MSSTQRQRRERYISPVPTLNPSSRIPAPPGSSAKHPKPAHQVSAFAERPSRTALLSDNLGTASLVESARRLSTAQPGYDSTVPRSMTTPSLFSGSSRCTFDSPLRPTLRHKPSGAIKQSDARKRSDSAMMGSGRPSMDDECSDSHQDIQYDTVLGISIPQSLTMLEYRFGSANPAQECPDLCQSPSFGSKSYRYSSSGTPSTRYADSPFSHVLTPSSASSCSPALAATSARNVNSPEKIRGTVRHDSAHSQPAPPSFREASISYRSTSRTEVGSAQSKDRPMVAGSTDMQLSNDSKSANRNRLTKAKPPVTIVAPRVRIPPELAHLNVDLHPPRASGSRKAATPGRPSRSGASGIIDRMDASSTEKKDVAHLHSTNQTPILSQAVVDITRSPSRSRFGFRSKSSSRTTSPRVDSAISPTTSTRQNQQNRTPDTNAADTPRLHRKDSPALLSRQGPSKSPRFSFFSRRANSDGSSVTGKPKRSPSKGPAAGTGHEAYAMFGSRGRTGSSTSTDYRSTSADSSASLSSRPWTKRKGSNASSDASDFEDFLRERQHPVILRGKPSRPHVSGMAEQTMTVLPAPAFQRSQHDRATPTSFQNAALSSSSARPTPGQWMSSEKSNDFPPARRPELNLAQPLHPLSGVGTQSTHQLLGSSSEVQPNTRSSNDTPEPNRYPHSTLRPLATCGNGGMTGLESKSKTSKSKWNFLQRANAKPRLSNDRTALDEAVRTPPHPQLQHRAAAHYALLDRSEVIALQEVVRMVQDSSEEDDADRAGVKSTSAWAVYKTELADKSNTPSSDCRGEDLHVSAVLCTQRLPSVTADQPQKVGACNAVVCRPAKNGPPGLTIGRELEFNPGPNLRQRNGNSDLPDDAASGRASPEPSDPVAKMSRLASIGRIPAVVSRRDRERTLSINSFSRPFARSQPRPSVKPPGSVYNQIREMASPADSSSQPVSSTSARSDGIFDNLDRTWYAYSSLAPVHTSSDVNLREEFLTPMPSRKDSGQSSTSENQSWLNLVLQPQQEDVWDDEYNAFMDEIMPSKIPPCGSSVEYRVHGSSRTQAGEVQTFRPLPLTTLPPASQIPRPPGTKSKSTVLTVPEQISRFLQPSMSPMSASNVMAFVEGYGDVDRSTSTLETDESFDVGSSRLLWAQQRHRTRGSSCQDSIDCSQLNRRSTHSRSASFSEAIVVAQNRYAATSYEQPHGISKLTGSAEAPTKLATSKDGLRLGALMTSKWLSFGQVLFSPAHNETQLADQPRILVVDGLTSDWAKCIARSYRNAKVYNMTPRESGDPTSAWSDTGEPPPGNYRKVPLNSISDSFPFPKGFFASVVLRFPTASTEQCHSACVLECRRVLRPGGHIEVVALDLDLKNMGPKARLAVRGVKTRMQQGEPEVCLKNLSDVLVRLLGKHGFEAVQRCMVGVPVAGKIRQSKGVTTSSVSSDSMCNLSSDRGASGIFPKAAGFADAFKGLQADIMGRGNDSDEKITKMMARVGRWWYAACYEKALLPSDHSIWTDPTLLRECHKQDTSFRLLICHAQKPFQTCRRTVSV